MGASCVVALGLLLAPQARANHVSSGLSVSIGSPVTRVSGVYLAVPVDVACPVLEAPFTGIFSDQINVSVTQKSGTDFAFGSGAESFQSPIFNGVGLGTPIACDGIVHTHVINVFPALQLSSPFHGGAAVATASLGLTLYDPSNPGFFNTDQNSANSGPVSIKIRR
jgi:hypothetical protein